MSVATFIEWFMAIFLAIMMILGFIMLVIGFIKFLKED